MNDVNVISIVTRLRVPRSLRLGAFAQAEGDLSQPQDLGPDYRHHEAVPVVFNAIDAAMTDRGATNAERTAIVGEAAFTWLELVLGDPVLVADLFVKMAALRHSRPPEAG